MEVTGWITILIAIYGAILSTYLAVMRVLREKKQLSMILEYKVFSKKGFLVVANSGHRPITVRKIIVGITHKTSSGEPHDLYFSPISPMLPSFIRDGETIIYEFGDDLAMELINIRQQQSTGFAKCKSDISIIDGEKNSYDKIMEWSWHPE
jgi:hypothetical protein